MQLQRRLQQDSIVLAGKTIFLNPFLYWRRFDANTDRWLREPGQLPEEQIEANRLRFYPELDWQLIEPEERAVKDGAVEMFLKTLELISTFNPDLSAGHLLEVERKMAVTKKKAFERWVERALNRRLQEKQRERRRCHEHDRLRECVAQRELERRPARDTRDGAHIRACCEQQRHRVGVGAGRGNVQRCEHVHGLL